MKHIKLFESAFSSFDSRNFDSKINLKSKFKFGDLVHHIRVINNIYKVVDVYYDSQDRQYRYWIVDNDTRQEHHGWTLQSSLTKVPDYERDAKKYNL